MPVASPLDVVEDAVRRRGSDLVELSHAIHAEPELAFDEHRSCAKAQALVAERGFEVTERVAGLDTAFRADFGSGPLVVGICAEYDALPEIGHACGHNIIAASAVGTALALSEVADDLGLRVSLLGTPAEEAGGGKALMLQAGTFDDVAVAVMLHPGPTDIAGARSLALSEVIVRYLGKESHAAVAPFLGLNAADAVTVAQVAVGLLRQQLAPGQMTHGIVTNGGQAVNVIPGHATLQYAMRALEADSLRELEGRMFACFAAGALATGCEYEIDHPAPPYDELKPDRWLADTFRDEMRRLGRDPVTPEVEAALPMGSTDMGNVTQVLPGIHPVVGVDAGGATVHQRAFAAAAAGPSADRAVVEGAIMLARTVVQLAQDPAERDRVLAAQQVRASSDRKRGEAGRSGSRGSVGSDRKRGEAGRSGSRGSVGSDRKRGEAGRSGSRGSVGSDRKRGEAGRSGSRGSVGSDRKRGEAGRSGSRGSVGSDRKRGEAGRSGSRGSVGSDRKRGEAGRSGSRGSVGSDRKRGEAGRSGSRGSVGSDRKRGEAGRSGSRPSASGAAG